MQTIQTAAFRTWLDGLKDQTAKEKIAIRIARAQAGNMGTVKSLGDQVSEIKIDYGPGYRLYYTVRGSTIIYLLIGGNKKTQKRDIATAKGMAAKIS